MNSSNHGPKWRLKLSVALLLSASMLGAACGGGTDEGGKTPKPDGETSKPVMGGKVTYGLEAENAEGWCLPEAQLAISGIQIARTIYDTLTAPNADGEYVPFLAKSVTPNADFTEWTIGLREGIKFHDGTDLTAEVVKNNIDAYRGTYEARKPLLFTFVFKNIADVSVTDPLTVVVTTTTPWSAFPSALFQSGRMGIMAQSQLDDAEHCDTTLVGTGPFTMVEWNQNENFLAKKNPGYWGKDSDGKQLPYLDEIEYKPLTEGSARTNAVLAGDVDAVHTPAAEQIDILRQAADDGKITNNESDKFTEVEFIQLNASKAPFDNKNARLALITSVDMEVFNQSLNLGIDKVANGPFAPGNMGYLKDTGYPKYDQEAAKKYVAAYKKDTGKDLEFSLVTGADAGSIAIATVIQEMAKKVGMKSTVSTLEQAALVSAAIGGDFEAMDFRNYPGGDPDTQYDWWKGGSFVNFSRFDDPEINSLLEEGRATDDTAKRTKIYEDVNRRFASEGYSQWLYWVLWDVATATNVHGVLGPDLPDGSKPFTGLATGHPVSGMWVSE